MSLLAELFGFGLYVVQQTGILLGVGAELVLLVSYLLHIQARESGTVRFVVPARYVERFGLGLIVLSGLGVVLYHVLGWDVAILMAPAFIAKWVLIGAVLIGYQVEQLAEARVYSWRSVVHGCIGGTWLALFILHMLAPDTTLLALVVGYVAWMAFFGVVWGGFVTALSPRAMVTTFATSPAPTVVTAPVVVPAPIPMPKISMPTISLPTISVPKMPEPPVAPKASVPTVYHEELAAPKVVAPAPVPIHINPAPAPIKPVVMAAPAPKAPVKAAPAPSPNDSGLPKIWVMPRAPKLP